MKQRIPIAKNDSIPDINFYKKAFEKFKSSAGTEYDDVIKSFFDSFNSYPIIPLHFASKELLESIEVYRVISEDELINLGLDKNKLSSFSHPPFNSSPQQRFNTKGHPVFYASSTAHTAICEKSNALNSGKSFYLSKWVINNTEPLTYIMLFYKNGSADLEFKSVRQTLDKKFDDLFRIYSKEKRRALKYLLEQLTKLSLADPYDSLTSTIGHYYFYSPGNVNVGFIIYPSVKINNGVNYAFNANLIKNGNLVCTEVHKIKLEHHVAENTHTRIEEVGIVENGNIHWKKLGYRFESAIFYDNNNHEFLKFKGDDIRLGRFNSYDAHESITVEEYLSSNLISAITDDIVKLANKNEEYVLKQYNCTIPESVVINEVECKKVEVLLKFHYAKN